VAASKKTRFSVWLPTLTAAAATALCLWLWPAATAGFLEGRLLLAKVILPLARALVFMSLGLTAALVIETMGLSFRLGQLAQPLTRWARLPEVAAASFTTALVSNPAANALLSEALEQRRIGPRALAVANLLNGSWPSFIVHLPTTLVVSTSFAGRAGLAYTAIMFAAATLRLFGAALLGRLTLPRPAPAPGAEPAEARKIKAAWPELRKRLRRRLVSLISVAGPVYYLITLAAASGFFEAVEHFAAARLPGFFLPAEAAALVVFSFTSEFSSGFAAAGALIQSSGLTVAEAAAALIFGNIIATPLRVLRWQLAAYLGFFQVRLGLGLIFANQAFRILSLGLALWFFWRFFRV
jgi:hypothetical protein